MFSRSSIPLSLHIHDVMCPRLSVLVLNDRFDYSKEFLMWALTPPDFLVEWHVGVRTSSNNKLVALITAVPADIRVHSSIEKMVEINFLCVHKKIRYAH
jgi:hypothetical protein